MVKRNIMPIWFEQAKDSFMHSIHPASPKGLRWTLRANGFFIYSYEVFPSGHPEPLVQSS